MTVTETQAKATLFKELISKLQQDPDFLVRVKARLGSCGSKNVAPAKTMQNLPVGNVPGTPETSRDVLMPSASSADAFFRNANGQDILLNQILKADATEATSVGSPDSGIWAHNKENGTSSTNSVPLYKRSAAGSALGKN